MPQRAQDRNELFPWEITLSALQPLYHNIFTLKEIEREQAAHANPASIVAAHSCRHGIQPCHLEIEPVSRRHAKHTIGHGPPVRLRYGRSYKISCPHFFCRRNDALEVSEAVAKMRGE
jgi:hypothetical protein